jgi:hypothetical protein
VRLRKRCGFGHNAGVATGSSSGRWLLSGRTGSLLVITAVLAGCTTGKKASPVPGVEPSLSATAQVSAAPQIAWPAPRADRPRVTLAFDATAWRTGQIAGTEGIDFTPDKRICELDFRLWPNKPVTADAGDSLTVTSSAVNAVKLTPVLSADGGSKKMPTLAVLRLKSCAKAGTSLHIDLGFVLTLGLDVQERAGRQSSGGFAWFDCAFPMLAWEYGSGWMRDPAVNLSGDMSGSEDFELQKLSVTAPSRDVVTGTGQVGGTHDGPAGTTVHDFAASAVRDVAVAVGAFTVLNQQDGDVLVHIATPRSTVVPAAVWASSVARSLSALEEMFGPYPYRDLWLTVLEPTLGSGDPFPGDEFPGGAFVADVNPATDAPEVVSHELAHGYFSGLVGNDQGRDPWLDEAWATWAALVIDGPSDPDSTPLRVPIAGPAGAPMTYWAAQASPVQTYTENVYGLGALALDDAYHAVGPAAFDAAARAYLTAEAHKIARPDDVEKAFAGLPKAEEIMQSAGLFTSVGASVTASTAPSTKSLSPSTKSLSPSTKSLSPSPASASS